MILLQENKPQLIVITTKSQGEIVERLPNQMIWDINNFLMKNANLYEFYFSKHRESNERIKISKPLFGRNKYLCFEKLNQIYVKVVDYDEQECRDEYIKHADEVADFNIFREIYLMETINELNYIAVENIETFLSGFKDKLNDSTLNSEKHIKSLLCEMTLISVFIGDHDWIEIHVRDSNIQETLVRIVSKYLSN